MAAARCRVAMPTPQSRAGVLLTFAALRKPTLNPDQVAELGLRVMFVGDKSEGSQSVQLHNVSGFLPLGAGIRFILTCA